MLWHKAMKFYFMYCFDFFRTIKDSAQLEGGQHREADGRRAEGPS